MVLDLSHTRRDPRSLREGRLWCKHRKEIQRAAQKNEYENII